MLGYALVLTGVLACGGPPASAVDREALDRGMFELQLVPLDGRRAPVFQLERLDGGLVSLSEFRGRVVLLYFWASW
jgi:hypothetical protein